MKPLNFRRRNAPLGTGLVSGCYWKTRNSPCYGADGMEAVRVVEAALGVGTHGKWIDLV